MTGLGKADPGEWTWESASQRWGEVRDLGGAGLRGLNLSHQEPEGVPVKGRLRAGQARGSRRTHGPAHPGARGAQVFGGSRAIGDSVYHKHALTSEQAPWGSQGKLQ